jgi:CheY-like chemotaxis protein
MDIQMPDGDGISTTRRIREEMGADKGPAIIAMTAHAMEGDKTRCLQAGMDDYISKPFRREELADMLRRYGKLAPKDPE